MIQDHPGGQKVYLNVKVDFSTNKIRDNCSTFFICVIGTEKSINDIISLIQGDLQGKHINFKVKLKKINE